MKIKIFFKIIIVTLFPLIFVEACEVENDILREDVVFAPTIDTRFTDANEKFSIRFKLESKAEDFRMRLHDDIEDQVFIYSTSHDVTSPPFITADRTSRTHTFRLGPDEPLIIDIPVQTISNDNEVVYDFGVLGHVNAEVGENFSFGITLIPAGAGPFNSQIGFQSEVINLVATH